MFVSIPYSLSLSPFIFIFILHFRFNTHVFKPSLSSFHSLFSPQLSTEYNRLRHSGSIAAALGPKTAAIADGPPAALTSALGLLRTFESTIRPRLPPAISEEILNDAAWDTIAAISHKLHTQLDLRSPQETAILKPAFVISSIASHFIPSFF